VRTAAKAVSDDTRRRVWLGPALVAASVLAVAVHVYGLYRVTGPPTVTWFPNSDKLEHALGFGLPVFLILTALDWYGLRSTGRQWIVVGIFAAHAVVSELIQHWFYTMRTGDPRDALADWIGIALGWLGYRLVVTRRGWRRR
jgi:hypothetical protein